MGFGEQWRAAVGEATVTDALSVAVPPGPEQEIEYVVPVPGAAETEPEVAPPVEKFVPAQESAPVEDQASVVDWPSCKEDGAAVKEALGMG